MDDITRELPNIFEYENYRKFLNDTYATMKARDKKFSFRYFARICGFGSHSFLLLIMQGKTSLSPVSIEKISKGLKFNPEQSRFFKNLVYLNQAKATEEKQTFAKEILRSQTYRKIHPLRESQYQYFDRWYTSAIRDLVGLPKFREDPQWIADHMTPKIKPEQAAEALKDLQRLGLLKRDENGRLTQVETAVNTPGEVSSAYVANWHRQYLKKAAESIDAIPREKRDITAVTFGFSGKNIKKVKQMIASFRKEIIQLALQDSERGMLYQLNIQLFPLADTENGSQE